MPLPRPQPKELRKDFLERCMGDPVMLTEYPDAEQRYAVCKQQYERVKIRNHLWKIWRG